jgi:hypothetical protein
MAMTAAGLPEGVAMSAAWKLRFPVQSNQAIATHPQFTVSTHQPKKYSIKKNSFQFVQMCVLDNINGAISGEDRPVKVFHYHSQF